VEFGKIFGLIFFGGKVLGKFMGRWNQVFGEGSGVGFSFLLSSILPLVGDEDARVILVLQKVPINFFTGIQLTTLLHLVTIWDDEVGNVVFSRLIKWYVEFMGGIFSP
jgi:hypothetical protein